MLVLALMEDHLGGGTFLSAACEGEITTHHEMEFKFSLGF